MSEASLADCVPLWRIVRDEGVTALVTPALDYVGGLGLGCVDARFASEESLEGLGEALRSLLAGLDDGCTLHFLYRVTDDVSDDIREYELGGERRADPAYPLLGPALARYVAARARWLRQQPLRKVQLHLFFSARGGQPSLARGQLGVRLFPASLARLTDEAHRARLKALGNLRNALQTRLGSVGLYAQELPMAAFQDVHRALLNPVTSGREASARAEGGTPFGSAQDRLRAERGTRNNGRHEVQIRDPLWDEGTVAAVGAHLREYTEAEQLVRQDLVEERGHLRQEKSFRRALTLKVLPEAGTHYFNAEPLLGLATGGADGEPAPFPYWLAVTVHLEAQGRARWALSAEHGIVDALKNAVPFLADNSVAKQARDNAKQRGIQALFEELNEMSSKLVTVSVTLLLDAPSIEALDERTEVARAAFAAAGNSELLLEEVSQLPAFLSVLPGAGPYQLRKKACTSRNAADFLPVFAPWEGTAAASSVLFTPARDLFRLDLFDKALAPAHHGLVVADTGSGKSVSLGALTLDALAAGSDAILVDNGGSWEPLTRLLGGVHVPVDIRTPITPFRSWNDMTGRSGPTERSGPSKKGQAATSRLSDEPDNTTKRETATSGLSEQGNRRDEPNNTDPGQLDPEAIQDVVTYLELCVREEGQRGFDKLTVQLLAKAVRRAYEGRFQHSPHERPLMSAFRDAVKQLGVTCAHPDDKRICEDVHRRLSLFVGDELYGTFLDRPSTLRFDAPLLTFDMAGVSKSPITRSIAMATVMQAVATRAGAQLHGCASGPTRRPTLCVVDEGHAYLGQDETAERFLERCYRVMRKFDVSMWMISQRFGDFVKAKSGEAIVGNSSLKIFLRHSSGHDVVSDFFHLSPRADAAFRALSMRSGRYSDFFLLYGERMTTVRLGLHPLAYWILSTDPADKALIARAQAKNPQLERLEVLEHLAKRFPHGAR